jgi:predicted Fe-Mo cluster-binding NifX family protein
MRIAIPVSGNDGELSIVAEHFGHVRFMAIYDSKTKGLEMVGVQKTDGCSPVSAIENLSIDAIYCFGMGMRAISLCKEKGIELKTGKFRTVKDVINNLDKLKELKESCGH